MNAQADDGLAPEEHDLEQLRRTALRLRWNIRRCNSQEGVPWVEMLELWHELCQSLHLLFPDHIGAYFVALNPPRVTPKRDDRVFLEEENEYVVLRRSVAVYDLAVQYRPPLWLLSQELRLAYRSAEKKLAEIRTPTRPCDEELAFPATYYDEEYGIPATRLRQAAHRKRIRSRLVNKLPNYLFEDVKRNWPQDITHDPKSVTKRDTRDEA